MSSYTDQRYLREEQYRDESNLRARMDLHERFSTNPQPWHRWVFEQLDLAADARVLEVGCGPAELWRQNLVRIPEGWVITLSDLSGGMLDAAREWFGDRADYVVADVQDLPFENGSFDAAIANHMLYHVSDRPRALAELARVLRPGGVLFAATNGRDHLQELDVLREQPRSLREMNEAFGLESGEGQLAESFVDVEVELYESDLDVTEVEPALAYLRSGFGGAAREAEEVIRAEIERRGSFHVTKSSGLFRARKP